MVIEWGKLAHSWCLVRVNEVGSHGSKELKQNTWFWFDLSPSRLPWLKLVDHSEPGSPILIAHHGFKNFYASMIQLLLKILTCEEDSVPDQTADSTVFQSGEECECVEKARRSSCSSSEWYSSCRLTILMCSNTHHIQKCAGGRRLPWGFDWLGQNSSILDTCLNSPVSQSCGYPLLGILSRKLAHWIVTKMFFKEGKIANSEAIQPLSSVYRSGKSLSFWRRVKTCLQNDS